MKKFNASLGCYYTVSEIEKKIKEANQKSKEFYKASDKELGKYWSDFSKFLHYFLTSKLADRQRATQYALDDKENEGETNAAKWLLDLEEKTKIKKYQEKQNDIKIGDVVKAGKFKNKKITVKGFGKDENNQPTIIPEKGKEIKIYNVRIDKLMPKKEKNMKKYRQKLKEKLSDDLMNKNETLKWMLQNHYFITYKGASLYWEKAKNIFDKMKYGDYFEVLSGTGRNIGKLEKTESNGAAYLVFVEK
jgi:hypothetical protein